MAVYRPRSVDEAVRIVAESDVPPALLAGGTDMVAQFNEGRAPRSVLALGGLTELRTIALRDGELHLGGLATHADGSAHPSVRRTIPGFAAAWSRIANVRVRFTATMGGNLMARRTRYEMPILLAALDSRIHFALPGTTIVADADDFAQHMLSPRAILTHASVPLAGLLAFDYDRTLRPIMTLALCIRRVNGILHGRAVIGTEAMDPYVLDFGFEHDDLAQIAIDPGEIARAVFQRFPADVRDPLTSNVYLRGAGTSLLARQLVRVARGAN